VEGVEEVEEACCHPAVSCWIQPKINDIYTTSKLHELITCAAKSEVYTTGMR
jgi:hypothetical protein